MLLYHWRFHARNQVTFLEESGLQVFTQLTTVFKFCFCSSCRFISCITRVTLYFNTTIPDPLQHATPYSSLPTTTSQILPWLSMSPDLNPNKHAWNELETSLRQNEHPCKHAWIVSGARAGVGGHPKASDWQLIQSMPKREKMLNLEEDLPPTVVRVSQPQNTEWLHFSLHEKRVKIRVSDLNQLQDEIWWIDFLLKFRTSIQL